MHPIIKEKITKLGITNLASDSRKVKPGSAFFAMKGKSVDGHNFIEDAIKSGAAIIFAERKTINSHKIVLIDDSAKALIIAANIIYKKLPKCLSAITGTNGKSSVCYFASQICHLLGHNAAAIGTLGTIIMLKNENDFLTLDSNLTTEDYLSLRKKLYYLSHNKIEYVFLEASSHGLHQNRLGDIHFDVCGFSSFSHDHLDYHMTMEDYLQSKLALFKNHLKHPGSAIINSDMEYTDQVIGELQKNWDIKITSVGEGGNCKINNLKTNIDSVDISFKYKERQYCTKINMLGSFQAYNILLACLIVEQYGFNIEDIIEVLPFIKGPPGRLEKVNHKNIFIDFAHSPDALERTIKELVALKDKKSKIITLFGCGGDRDKSKRAKMGKIAAQYSDIAIVTDDNPRNEEPASIRHNIMSEVNKEANIIEISNRKLAIYKAIDLMEENDILLIAGKGHEKYQIIGHTKNDFNEVAIVEEYVKRKNMEQG